MYSLMSRPHVTVLARDMGFAPLGWLAPFTTCAFKARATLTRVIAQTLRVPEPQASLLTGILLGDDAATRRRHLQERTGRLPHDGHLARNFDLGLYRNTNHVHWTYLLA